MIKFLMTSSLIFFSVTIFAADRFNLEQQNTRYRSTTIIPPTPTQGKISSFSQNAKSGYTNTAKYSLATKYDDKSYKTEYRLTPNSSRIIEYNALTKTYRDGIKTYYSGGARYIIKYNDGSIERAREIGQNLLRIEQKDNLGNARSGIQNNRDTSFDDGFTQKSYDIGGGIRIDETGKK